MPSDIIPWLTNVTTGLQRVDSERVWTVLIAIVVLSFVWVLGREIVRRLAGRAGGIAARERMSLPTSFQPESRWGTTDTERQDLDFAPQSATSLQAAPPR